MIIFYWLLSYVILPFIPLYLYKRSKKNSEYKKFWYERFMLSCNKDIKENIIWFHSVSVGETRAMQKMIALFSLHNPDYKILITVMTPTGRLTAENLYPNCIIRYVPYDIFHIVNKFLFYYKPKICILMETEIWPTLIYLCHKKNIPVILANARLSNRSYKNYAKFRFFISNIINKMTLILCQDQQTMGNFQKLNKNIPVLVTGNTKFDLIKSVCNKHFINFKHNLSKKVIILASSRDGEEELFINEIRKIENFLFIIVPRHPERFLVVEELLKKYNVKYQKRSDNSYLQHDTKVFLGDSMGEMFNYYEMSDLAVIGGSFLNYGGQNPIEPIFLKIPVIFGKSMFNFNDVSNNILQTKCGICVNNFYECCQEILKIFSSEMLYSNLKQNCDNFILKYSGASEINFKHCQKFL
jgi:3-deoxy-D-manno-octulosonic-acid transferase